MDVRRRLAFCVLLLLGARFAPAQSVTGTAGTALGADLQVTNAAQAAEEAFKGVEFGPSRSATGSIASLLTSSDTLICSAWIVSFRSTYRDMVTAAARGATNEELHALQKMRELLELVETACDDIINDPPPPGGEEGEDGEEDPEVEPRRYTYSQCPHCEDLIQARNQRDYEYRRDQYLLSQAMRDTDYARQTWDRTDLSRGEKALLSGTYEEVSARETELWDRVYLGERALRRAQKRVDDCLRGCIGLTETSFLRQNATPIGIGAAAAGVGAAFALRGGDDSTGGAAVTGATLGAAAGEEIGMTVPSYMACAGRYNSFWNIQSDNGGHGPFVAMPATMFFDVAIASIHISGPAPFVDVDGDIAEDGSFEATGMGVVAGFRDVSVRMTGTVTGCTDVEGTLRATYTMGVNGELPGGQSISYEVNATK